MMSEIRNPNQVVPSEEEVTRLDRLKATLDTANVPYTILAHDLTIRSAQEGVERGLGELANMAPTFILRCSKTFGTFLTNFSTSRKSKEYPKSGERACARSPDFGLLPAIFVIY